MSDHDHDLTASLDEASRMAGGEGIGRITAEDWNQTMHDELADAAEVGDPIKLDMVLEAQRQHLVDALDLPRGASFFDCLGRVRAVAGMEKHLAVTLGQPHDTSFAVLITIIAGLVDRAAQLPQGPSVSGRQLGSSPTHAEVLDAAKVYLGNSEPRLLVGHPRDATRAAMCWVQFLRTANEQLLRPKVSETEALTEEALLATLEQGFETWWDANSPVAGDGSFEMKRIALEAWRAAGGPR